LAYYTINSNSICIQYLNVFRPFKLSFEQLFLIALEVVNVCNEKEIDVSTPLSPDQLDEIIALSITSIRQVFKENGFRFIPKNLIEFFLKLRTVNKFFH
jgi:hypothetical protein